VTEYNGVFLGNEMCEYGLVSNVSGTVSTSISGVPRAAVFLWDLFEAVIVTAACIGQVVKNET
jgi:hypothetical protein